MSMTTTEPIDDSCELAVEKIPIELTDPNPFHVRKDFGGLCELENDIENNRLDNLIVLRKVGTRYQIKTGHRRFESYKNLGKKAVPARIVEATDVEMAVATMKENMVRKDLTSVEIENAIYVACKLAKDKGEFRSVEAFARSYGMDPSHIRHILKVKAFRDRTGVPPEISTESIRRVVALPDAIALGLLVKIHRGEITTTQLKDRAKDLKAFQGVRIAASATWDTLTNRDKGKPNRRRTPERSIPDLEVKQTDAVVKQMGRVCWEFIDGTWTHLDGHRKMRFWSRRLESIYQLAKVRKSATKLLDKIESNLDIFIPTFNEVF